MIPMEVVAPSLRVSKHNGLNPQEYNEVMMMELKELDGKRLQELDHIMIQKKKVASVTPRIPGVPLTTVNLRKPVCLIS